jgi:predicted helicase
MSKLQTLLDLYRTTSQTEREKGTYFEQLILAYLQNEPKYKDLYQHIWTYADWARSRQLNAQDAGIDLVAQTTSGELHAIQCKLYRENYTIQKADIDSFFTASGKTYFTHRIIVSTTNNWSHHAEEALRDQNPPVTKIDLHDLEQSQIDWGQYHSQGQITLKPKKNLRPHQSEAVREVLEGLKTADRGKLIMACGTGKTFTSLKIAESLAGPNKRVLFLVPSLALLSQALTEWTQESAIPLHSFAVCSDSDVGKKRQGTAQDDAITTLIHELRYPATTDALSLSREIEKRHDDKHMSVVFSTYHSIDVIHQAQKHYDLADFDLIICDEAHRTTGYTAEGEDDSAFVRVHDPEYLRSAKRLYMTATPRIYADSAKATAEQANGLVYSMDDETIYGKELHVITFSRAVQLGLLVDYKVIVLAVEESHVNRRLQGLLTQDNQLRVDDAARIVGCWKALAKQNLHQELNDDLAAMRRAVAFCQVIEPSTRKGAHRVSSKHIAQMFQEVANSYQESEEIPEDQWLRCEAKHIDGSMNASQKEEKLQWLKAPIEDNTCRILSNVRCLSEGVDVPALDAVLFLSPRNSAVDVVQSVGRVMRTAPGKQRGYVILPVVIPAGIEPHEALNDNKTYAVVWQVLQALRSHDDRFDAMINKMDLELNQSIISKMEVIAITDKIPSKVAQPRNTVNTATPTGKPSQVPSTNLGAMGRDFTIAEAPVEYETMVQQKIAFEISDLERAMYAKVVQKCGNRHHWEDWAKDIAAIARTHIDRITAILENPANHTEREAFEQFAQELRDDLNDSISDGEIIEMLAQHLITKPVFDALFSDYSFASHNPISLAMQDLLNLLHEHHLEKERDTLERFYESVRFRAQGIESATSKQKIIVELYDKFFRNAFPKMSERLGIVYTPVEVVDFIIRSVNDILQQEFGQDLGSKGVHIIDPFTGTGTFITRLLQSGLIKPADLPYKYQHEIHANEIVLLAYYIAAINIESIYHSLVAGEYQPFDGICLTDTFQMYEKEDLFSKLLVDNSKRRRRQKELDIRVIIGNPPYSVGQDSANDNNQNIAYAALDERIAKTYVARSKATLRNSLYDSYIRAIRWASDRIGDQGVIGFVTNAGFIEGNTAAGLRQCLAEEFSNIYIFHLRGNQRTQGEQSRKEGGKIFGSGSRAPIAISLLVKNPQAVQQGQIHFYDIGDYLSREQKLNKISELGSIQGLSQQQAWQVIQPDEYGDWLNQRDKNFMDYIVLGDKAKKDQLTLFTNYSNGVKTNRDAWCYNSSAKVIDNKMQGMIEFYNAEVTRFKQHYGHIEKKQRELYIDSFLNTDSTKISWTREIRQDLNQFKIGVYDPSHIVPSLYRPFSKQWLYFDRMFNNCIYQIPQLFPSNSVENRVILVNTKYNNIGQIALMSAVIPDLHSNGDAQSFPLYLYEEAPPTDALGLFDEQKEAWQRKDAITDAGLQYFQAAYPQQQISKEDIFYYVYGLLHSPAYRERFADNLSKELPRIPCVKQAADFWAFSQAGRELADLHIDYEQVEPYAAQIEISGQVHDQTYRVEKMKYGKQRLNGKLVDDKTTLIYNNQITVSGIPLEAYEYVVNGKAALDWVVERQAVKTDKDSGIVNDANAWANETMGDAKYPLELFLRVVTVSLETKRIVAGLPNLDI